jgi:flagellar hook-basal body complex protein FliE
MEPIGRVQSIGGAGRSVLGQERPGLRVDAGAGDGPSFAETLKNALGEVSELEAGAKDAIGAFLRGEPIEIHEVMAATEEAGIALEMLIEIRNKLTEAYRTVSQMQQ